MIGIDKALKVLRSIERMGEKQFIPSIGPLKGKIVEKIIIQHSPKTILEVGTLFGYSAILMARLLPNDGKVVTIEIDKKSASTAKKNIENAGLSGKIDLIVGDALEVIPNLDDSFDLLFIDAAKEWYLKYLELAENNLKEGSVVVADNAGIFNDRMVDYLNYVRNSGAYESKTIKTKLEFTENVEDAIEVSIKVKKTVHY